MKQFFQKFFDAACILSIIGIWPRFVEPNLLVNSNVTCPIPNLPTDLEGFRIVQFSDLHIGPAMPNSMLKKIRLKIRALKPDLLVFTGDFLCYSNLDPRLRDFLCSLSAPYGAFAILGNHDYDAPVVVNPETGDYDTLKRGKGDVAAGLKLLKHPTSVTGHISESVQGIDFQKDLSHTIALSPFRLLHNETCHVKVKNSRLNLVGLGEHTLGRDNPEKAFNKYDKDAPGIVLAHNPDSIPKLLDYPGELILSGHTHGAQINLPLIRSRLTLMENPRFARGRVQEHDKLIYVNRGVGSVFKFRLGSIPEITTITLTRSDS